MTLTDEELDRDWQPNGRRPQSSVSPIPAFALSIEDARHVVCKTSAAANTSLTCISRTEPSPAHLAQS